jgi:mono/diheme cytochrome c family protein
MKTIIGLLLAAVLVAGYVMGTGVYNMAATEKHWMITEKLIEWMRINSIAARANELEIPALDESESLSVGALHYNAMCTGCHLSPGQEPTELAQGLYPQAPVFHQRTPLTDIEALQKQTKSYFWVIKNGIKMTAMPAWGLTHDDETIWAMAFFVQKLEGMPASTYDELTHTSDDSHHQHEHAHDHQHEQRDEHHHEHHGEQNANAGSSHDD